VDAHHVDTDYNLGTFLGQERLVEFGLSAVERKELVQMEGQGQEQAQAQA
jgi:hypothetical protein